MENKTCEICGNEVEENGDCIACIKNNFRVDPHWDWERINREDAEWKKFHEGEYMDWER